MKVLLEDKNQTVEIPDGLAPEAVETELRKFYTPEELYGSTTFMERESYRLRKGQSTVDDGKNWYQAMTGELPLDVAKQKSIEINAEFTQENDEKFQAHNWPERFVGATTELAPYMLDSAVQGALYGEGMGASAAAAALIGGQAGPQAFIPEEIITVPGAYIGGKAVGQAWGTLRNPAKVEAGGIYKSMIEDGVEPKTARNFALPAGYLIGAIELLQLERLIPGYGREGIKDLLKKVAKKGTSKVAPTLLKSSGRLAKNLAVTTALETAQEETQEIINITSEIGAGIYEDMATEKGYVGPDTEEVKERLVKTLTSSLLGFPLLGLPGSIHSTMGLAGREKFAQRVMTKKANKTLNSDLTEVVSEAAKFDDFKDFHDSLGEEIDDKFVNDFGFDNRTLFEEAVWNLSRDFKEADEYAENFKIKQEDGSGFVEGAKEALGSAAQSISRILEPISTRLKQINPKLKNKMRRYEFDLKQRVLQDEKAVKPFLDGYKKLSEKDKSDLDLAFKNSDTVKIDEIVKRNKLEAEFQSVKATLDALFARAKETGLDMGFIENYFPRQVKDVKGMLKFFQKEDTWPEMQKAIKKKEESLGRKMTDEEKAEMLNTMLRGFKGKGFKPGNVKQREISKVTPVLNKFYQDSPQALMNYIYRVNDFIEARRFFGKSAEGKEMSEKSLDDSIGGFVLDLLQSGDIKGTDAQDVSEILKARFSPKGPGKHTSAIKNISYLETMGSVTSAITQIGDIAFSLYKSGFYKTGKALAKSVAGTSEISREDIGIERIAEEFSDKSKTAKALEVVFKLTGLSWMDRMGKESFINAAFDKFSAQAKNPNKKFTKQMADFFGDQAEQITEDLKNKVASDNVKFLLFSELADFQPIALSEMPEKYLTSGNGRLLYMLKTYAIKQIDVFRNEVFIDMGKRPAEALGNLIRLSALVILANGTADILKDLILGRPLESQDDEDDYLWVKLVDNIIRLFGLSKYSLYKFKKDGVWEGITSIILPPIFSPVEKGAKDIGKMLKDNDEFEPHQAEIIQSVPFLGKLYYWWFGGGRKKIEDNE